MAFGLIQYRYSCQILYSKIRVYFQSLAIKTGYTLYMYVLREKQEHTRAFVTLGEEGMVVVVARGEGPERAGTVEKGTRDHG